MGRFENEHEGGEVCPRHTGRPFAVSRVALVLLGVLPHLFLSFLAWAQAQLLLSTSSPQPAMVQIKLQAMEQDSGADFNDRLSPGRGFPNFLVTKLEAKTPLQSLFFHCSEKTVKHIPIDRDRSVVLLMGVFHGGTE